jgi:oxygen-independent coproporphyrinogen-3 oxidase
MITRLESRPWFDLGAPLAPEEAELAIERERDPVRAFSVYIHVPYCGTRCTFCALYTRALPRHPVGELDRYLRCLSLAITRHPQLASRHPATTVHFGGGTPLSLGTRRLGQVIERLRARLDASTSCEWALETTTSSITEATLEALAGLGISRIHFGIQTLDEAARRQMGRRESGERALAKVARSLERGFQVSVDLLLGYPGLTDAALERDVAQLYATGVRMFSFCALRFPDGHAPTDAATAAFEDSARAQWRRVWVMLHERGLKPVHSGQFGRSDLDNLYYTHPARQEDCVALGPYAHGSCGDLIYQNRLVPDYYASLESGRPPIAGGMVFAPELRLARHLERELLGHRIDAATLARAGRRYGLPFRALVANWQEAGWIEQTDSAPSLTADGSWYVGNMVAKLRACAERDLLIPALG